MNRRHRWLLILFLSCFGTLAVAVPETTSDPSGAWTSPVDIEAIPVDYPRIDGGTSGRNSSDGLSKQFTDNAWASYYLWAADLIDSQAIGSLPTLGQKLKEIEASLCSTNARKSVLIINESPQLIRLISAYLAASADRAERGGTAKPCQRRVDFELVGQRLSGSTYIGTNESAWKKITDLSIGSLLWHIPEVAEIIGRGTHEGRPDSGAEGEFGRAMAAGQMKVLGGASPAYYARISSSPVAGVRSFVKSFGSVLIVEELDAKELGVLMRSLARSKGFKTEIPESSMSYLFEGANRHLSNLGTAFEAMEAVIGKIASYRIDPTFDETQAFSVPMIKKAIAQAGNFPAWVLDEAQKRKRMATLETEIGAKLVGQKEALHSSVRNIQIGFVSEHTKPKPIASLLYVGPTGTGKTYLAEQISRKLYGRAPRTIDMTQYSTPSSADAFVDLVADAIKASPYQVIVFEEIDKAHVAVLDKLYFLLDEGRMLNSVQRSVSAQGITLIATTNAAERVIGEFGPVRMSDANATTVLKSQVNAALQQFYRLSFLNRFDATPIFYPFSDEEYQRLAKVLVNEKAGTYAVKQWSVSCAQEVYDYFAAHGSSPLFGARPMERLVSLVIEGALTDFELLGDIDLDAGSPHIFKIERSPEGEDVFLISESSRPDDKVRTTVDRTEINFGR